VNTHIQVESQQADRLLAKINERVDDIEPFLRALGEDSVERIKQRFDAGKGPDGAAWAPNSPVTLARYIQSRGTSSAKKKRKAPAPAKKPLVATGEMSRGIHYQVNGGALVVASPAPQAFMLQFGGQKEEFPHLWGDIPARPFFPVQANGRLYPGEEEEVVEALRLYLTQD